MVNRFLNSESSIFRSLLPLALIGGAAIGGALYEAAHNNMTGAAAYMGIGATGMTLAGVIIDKNQRTN